MSNPTVGQRSVIHDTTADGEDSPISPSRPTAKSEPQHGRAPDKVVPEPVSNAVFIKDDSDNGGPIVITSDDPDLQNLDIPKLEYPGESVPNDGRAA